MVYYLDFAKRILYNICKSIPDFAGSLMKLPHNKRGIFQGVN